LKQLVVFLEQTRKTGSRIRISFEAGSGKSKKFTFIVFQHGNYGCKCPVNRQTLLFSATLTDDIRFLADTVNDNAAEISVSTGSATTPKIDQWLITVDKDRKSALLSHLINELKWDQALIFIENKVSQAAYSRPKQNI